MTKTEEKTEGDAASGEGDLCHLEIPPASEGSDIEGSETVPAAAAAVDTERLDGDDGKTQEAGNEEGIVSSSTRTETTEGRKTENYGIDDVDENLAANPCEGEAQIELMPSTEEFIRDTQAAPRGTRESGPPLDPHEVNDAGPRGESSPQNRESKVDLLIGPLTTDGKDSSDFSQGNVPTAHKVGDRRVPGRSTKPTFSNENRERSYLRYVISDGADGKTNQKHVNGADPAYLRYIDGTEDSLAGNERSTTYLDYIGDTKHLTDNAPALLPHNSCIRDEEDDTETVLDSGNREQDMVPLEGPGAYPAGMNPNQEDWLQGDYVVGDVEAGNEDTGDTTSHNNTNSEGLAIASPVSATTALGQAQYVDPTEDQRRAEQKKKTKRTLLAVIISTFVLLAGIVLVSFFVVDSENDNSTDVSNTGLAATLAPLSQEDLLLSLLPAYTAESIHSDKSSPQSQAFNWTLADPSFSSFQDWQKVQRFSLATFFFATGGQLENKKAAGKWLTNTHWLSYSKSECEWFSSNHIGPSSPDSEPEKYGLVASFPPLIYESGLCRMGTAPSGKVERLVFYANGLNGELPPELSLLTELRILAIVSNTVDGNIPSEIGQLTKLEFFGSVRNKLQGSIPSELGKAKNLTHLFLWQNQLTGTIPTELGALSDLKGLMMDENNLDGTLPTELGLLSNALWVSSYENKFLRGTIPSQFGQLSSVRFLGLMSNKFSMGTIPSQLGLLKSVQEVNIDNCNLTGSFPTELGQMESLELIYFSNERLVGQLPSEFGQLKRLQSMHLGWTKLSGTLPSEFFLASSLKGLGLGDCCYTDPVHGSIPTQIGLLSNLEYLDIRGTQLSSALPTELALLQNLQQLVLMRNNFSGEIPSELGTLRNVSHFELGKSNLSGSIPSELSQLSNARYFGIYENPLSPGARIPSQLALLTYLQHLQFRSSNLAGTIPTELGQLEALEGMFLSENRLSGQLPSEVGELRNLLRLHLEYSGISGTLPSDLFLASKLKELLLHGNTISGSIPTEIGVLSDLEWLTLDLLDITGSLPSEMGLLSNLQKGYFV